MKAYIAAGKLDSCAEGETELVIFFFFTPLYNTPTMSKSGWILMSECVRVCVQWNKKSCLSSTLLTVVWRQVEQKNSNLGLQHIPVARLLSHCRSDSSDQNSSSKIVSAPLLQVKETGKQREADSSEQMGNKLRISEENMNETAVWKYEHLCECVSVGVRSAYCRANHYQWHSGTWSLLFRQEAETRWWEMSGNQAAQKVPVGHSEKKKEWGMLSQSRCSWTLWGAIFSPVYCIHVKEKLNEWMSKCRKAGIKLNGFARISVANFKSE